MKSLLNSKSEIESYESSQNSISLLKYTTSLFKPY